MSYTSIDKQFAPLSRALLKEGRPEATAVIEGFAVRASRRRNLHVRFGGTPGPAWLIHYTVDGLGSGERCHMASAIHRATSGGFRDDA